jgi:protein TonB
MRVRIQSGAKSAVVDQSLGQPFTVSLAVHSLLVALAAFPLAFGRTQMWGEIGSGGVATPVNLVGGIPLPPSPVTNPVANDVPTMNPPEPKPVAKMEKVEPKEVAPPKLTGKEYQIEEKKQKKRWADIERERMAKELREFAQTPSNAIPGRGAPASNSMYSPMTTSQGSGGVGFGGDFGNQYGLYVRAVRDCISRHWDRSRIDPSVRSAPKVFVMFDIVGDGSIQGEKIATSSGIPSVDREALRAVQACSGRSEVGADQHLPPLPRDFGGKKVDVEVWFAFRQ